jgi:hypothetical protein
MDDTPNARSEPETRGAAFWLHVDAGHVRRGLQFLINIGVPLLVGVLRGESQIALAAVIVGMAFGFADSAGPLFSRLRFLALDALCIGVGAGLGYFARNHAALLVPFFVGLTLGIGLAPLTGRMLPLTGRHAAMAFTVAAALPVTFNLPQAGYLFGVFLLAAAARTVDYLIAGPLPRQPAVPLQPPSGHGGWLRYALAFAGAATAALWIGQALDPTHTIWVVATTLVVMQADARLSYRRIVEPIAGTFAGVAAAWVITGSQSIALIPSVSWWWRRLFRIISPTAIGCTRADRVDDPVGLRPGRVRFGKHLEAPVRTRHRHAAWLCHCARRHGCSFSAHGRHRARQPGRRGARRGRQGTLRPHDAGEWRVIGAQVCIASRAALPAARSAIRA